MPPYTHRVKKVSWKGSYSRILRLSTTEELQTLDPSTHRVTNSFALTDVLSVYQSGAELLIAVADGGCGFFCGLLKRELRLSLDSAAQAAAVGGAVRARLVRRLSVEDSERARERASEAAVVSAAPRDQLGGDLSGEVDAAGGSGDPFTFDVAIGIQKARSLPVPPPLCGGPVVSCAWGQADPAQLVVRRGSSTASSRHSSTNRSLVAGLPAASGDGAIDSDRASSHGRESPRCGASAAGGGGGSSAGGTPPPLAPGAVAATASCGNTPRGSERDGSNPSESGDPSGGGGLIGDVVSEEDGLGSPVEFSTQPGDGDACNPRWNYEACFRYQATHAELKSRRLVLTFYHKSWPLGTVVPFGTVTVSLMDIATGPNKYDLPVKNLHGGGISGRIVFSVLMVQQCGLSIVMPHASVTMRALTRHTSQASQEAAHRDSHYSLTASLTMGEAESAPTRTEFDSKTLKFTERAQIELQLPEVEKLEPRLALLAQASARAFDNESMHLCVWEHAPSAKQATQPFAVQHRLGGTGKQQRLLGEVWLPVTKVHAPSDNSHKRVCDTRFDEVLWLHGHRIGRLGGAVRIINGPSFIQLPGGFFTEQGIVPLGPIAAGAQVPGGGLVTGKTPIDLDASLQQVVDSPTVEASVDFEQPPKGLPLPKEVELLVSLVQSLRKVVLDLHLDGHGNVDSSGDASDAARSLDYLQHPSRSSQGGMQRSASQGGLQQRGGSVGGGGSGGGGSSEKSQLELLASESGGGGGSVSVKRSGMNRSASSESISDRLGGGRDSIRLSASVDRMADGGAGKLVGRLANSEMAARRLTFLLSRLQLLLGLSSKESCKAFFYSSVSALQWTQRLMLRLWAYLISQVDSMAFRYQPAVFDTLTLLMLRGELDCSAMLEAPTSLLERYRRALWDTTAYVISKLSHKAAPTEVRAFCSQALAMAFFRLPALRHSLLVAILPIGESRHKHVREWNLPWSLQKASLAEAEQTEQRPRKNGRSGAPERAPWLARNQSNLTLSPAQPSPGSILQSSQSMPAPRPGELGGSATAPQLSSTTSVTCTTKNGGGAAPGGGGANGQKKSPRSSPRIARRNTVGEATVAAAMAASAASCAQAYPVDGNGKSANGGSAAPPQLPPPAVVAGVAPTTSLGAAALALSDADEKSKSLELPERSIGGRGVERVDQWTQLWRTRLDSSSSSSERTLSGRYWKERLHKRGHCFFLLLEYWMRHVSMAMGMQPEGGAWKEVPGFPTLMKAFLIEMKQRPLHMWPESMISCLVSLLKENRQLLQVAVRILLARVSPLQLRSCLAVLQHLDACMKAVANEQLPQTFSCTPLLRTLHTLAESEHFKVAASALIFLYNHLDALGEGARLESLGFLHQRFAAFSLHWSRVVRTIFFHIAVIKVLNWTPPPSASPMRRSVSEKLEEFSSSGGLKGANSEIENLLSREQARRQRSFGDSVNAAGAPSDANANSNGRNGSIGSNGSNGSNGKLERKDSEGRLQERKNSLGSSSSSLNSMLPNTASLNSMRDVENLLEFHRLKDQYETSIAALKKLSKAAQAEQSQVHSQNGNGHGPGGNNAAAMRNARFGGGRGGGMMGGRGRGMSGGRGGGGLAAIPPPRVTPQRSSPAARNSKGNNPTPAFSPRGDLSPLKEGDTADAQIAEAAAELGLGAAGSADVRNKLGYAIYSWAEYEQVVRKYEAAAASTARAASEEEARRNEALRDGSSGATIGKSASMSSLGQYSDANSVAIRRVNSEPSLPPPPNPLALSLSMISAHVHDDEDDAAPPEEW